MRKNIFKSEKIFLICRNMILTSLKSSIYLLIMFSIFLILLQISRENLEFSLPGVFFSILIIVGISVFAPLVFLAILRIIAWLGRKIR